MQSFQIPQTCHHDGTNASFGKLVDAITSVILQFVLHDYQPQETQISLHILSVIGIQKETTTFKTE